MSSGSKSVRTAHRKVVVCIMVAWLCAVLCGNCPQCEASTDSSSQSWKAPGCHLVGHTRRVKMHGCLTFHVTTNACRGFCLSFAYPTPESMLMSHPEYIFTSKASCCNIIDTVDIPVQVRCGEVLREVVFKSARSCGCSICRRG